MKSEVRVCRCGKEFETTNAKRKSCSTQCLGKFAHLDNWHTTSLDYRIRCSRLSHIAKNRAKKINCAFDLSPEFIINMWEDQQGRCALSGREFDLTKPKPHEKVRSNAVSLDKIDAQKGYTKDNVRLVCFQVNGALNQYGEKELISLCKDILEYNTGAIH